MLWLSCRITWRFYLIELGVDPADPGKISDKDFMKRLPLSKFHSEFRFVCALHVCLHWTGDLPSWQLIFRQLIVNVNVRFVLL